MVNAPAMLEGYLASSDILACYALSGELQKEEMPIQAKLLFMISRLSMPISLT